MIENDAGLVKVTSAIISIRSSRKFREEGNNKKMHDRIRRFVITYWLVVEKIIIFTYLTMLPPKSFKKVPTLVFGTY